MKSLNQLAIALLICSAVLLTQTVHAQSLPIGPQQGILLLKNGNLFEGAITPSGDYLTVALNEGAVIRLPKSSIASRCNTMEEAYEFHKSQLGTLKLKNHLELTQWCLSNKLFEQATHHLLFCVSSSPEDPRVMQMERRYRLALQPKPEPSIKPTSPIHAPLTQQQLEQVAGSLPLGGLRNFTTKVQPMLLKGCGTTTCHGQASKSEFKLMQFEHIRSIPRMITLRNLNSTLQFTNRTEPNNSLLMKKLRTTHANMPELSTPAAHDQIRLLAQWIYSISSRKAPSSEQVTKVEPALYQKIETQETPSTILPVSANSIFSPNPQATAPSTPQAGVAPFKTPARRPETKGQYQAKDPFDPELFNRKFHPVNPKPIFNSK